MSTPKRRPATHVFWQSPIGLLCTLEPLDRTGVLEIDVLDGEVLVHSRNCLLSMGTGADAEETEYAEFEFSVALDRCQINWHTVEKTPDADIERSIHFQNR
jgi:hypothetical protein